MNKKYKVVSAYRPETLTFLVETYLADMWALVGGVCRDSQGMYHQALVK